MPLFLDIHSLDGAVTLHEVAQASLRSPKEALS